MRLLLALLGSLSLAPVCETGACSCMPPASPVQAMAAADAIFTARVVSVRDILVQATWSEDPKERRPRRRVTLQVDRAWKGVEAETVTLETGLGGGDCGFPFRKGGRYLVYAHRAGNDPSARLGAGICGRTTVESRAGEDLRVLGEPARTWPG